MHIRGATLSCTPNIMPTYHNAHFAHYITRSTDSEADSTSSEPDSS